MKKAKDADYQDVNYLKAVNITLQAEAQAQLMFDRFSKELSSSQLFWTQLSSGLYTAKELQNILDKNPDIDLHYDNDGLFKKLCKENNIPALTLLIIDFKLEETKEIKNYLLTVHHEQAQNLFSIRNLNQKLNENLINTQNVSTATTRSKI